MRSSTHPRLLCLSGMFLLMSFPLSAHAMRAVTVIGAEEVVSSASSSASRLSELEARAAQAEPRERCYLYTELLHEWTEVAGRSLAAGDTPNATLAMQHADANAAHLKDAINRDSKRLKNAELLLSHSVRRLSDMLRVSSEEQHDTVQAVLRHVSNVHDDLLAAVFTH